MKLLFYISVKKTNSKKEAPIYCRLTLNKQRAEFSTGIFINPSNFKSCEVLQSHPQANIYNLKLDFIKSKINAIHLDFLLKNTPVNPEHIKLLFQQKPLPQSTFADMIKITCDKIINDLQSAASTRRTYVLRHKKTVEYLHKTKQQNIICEKIDLQFIQKFECFLKDKKFKQSYINKNIAFVGQVLNTAIEQGLIQSNCVKFYKKGKVDKTVIIALTKDELIKLCNYTFASDRIQQTADLYIFQCYTGFAYVDMCNFNYGKSLIEIDGKKWINENRAKTNIQTLLPFFEIAQIIFDKYNKNLPILSNQKYNSYLKEVAAIIGISKNLTAHTARKTFAMVKLNEGFSIESVAKMLGHASIKITQSTYAQVSHVRILNEMQKIGVR